ncbi:MAG: hypothetical protein ABI091_11705 [Ferruginibacter sp.]|jgi:hypothetical protein
MDLQSLSLVIIPQEELAIIKGMQQEILLQLKELNAQKSQSFVVKNFTALEFMAAVHICRSKFDQLVNANKIKVIKKKRKIYVPVSEVDRYFSDTSIQ